MRTLYFISAMHFHVPPLTEEGKRPSSRQLNAYTANLYGRRSRSHSRTGMRVLVDQLEVNKIIELKYIGEKNNYLI